MSCSFLSIFSKYTKGTDPAIHPKVFCFTTILLADVKLTSNAILNAKINDELKKSMYDEMFNGGKCDIPELFAGQLESFLNDLTIELLFDSVDHDKYASKMAEYFTRKDVEFTANEVFNYFVYENDEKLTYSHLFEYLTDICMELDIPTPVLTKTHVFNFAKFNHVKFLPRDFVETLGYDHLFLENLR